MDKIIELMDKIAKLFDGNFTNLYAAGVTVFGLSFISLFLFVSVPEGNTEICHTILGFVLGTMLNTAVSYVLGSSKSSSEKTGLLVKKENGNI